MLERVAGIEPASSAWKAEVIAIIRYPHMVPTTGIELVTYWLQVSCSTYWAKSALVLQGSDITERYHRAKKSSPSEPFSMIRFNIPIATTLCVKLCKFIYVFLFYVNISPSLKIYATIYKQIYFEGNIKCRFLYHTTITTKPAWWRVLLKFNCAWFASRYSFAKRSKIEAVYA